MNWPETTAVPSNLSTIGFDFAAPDEMREAMLRLAGEARMRLASAQGEYAIWRSRTGAELWFQLGPPSREADGERELIGLTPFFEGVSDIPVKVTAFVRRPDDTPLEGAFTAWVAPDGEGEGAYPLVFDAVDFATRSGESLPANRRVRLSGFARELKAYPTAAAYYAAQSSEPRFAAESFCPMGLFAGAAGDDDEIVPSSNALLTGTVLEHAVMVNEETGREFHWLLMQSLEATFDILADPAVVSGAITEGGTVETACWLFGRFLE